jgi:thioredoxin reductase
MTANNENTFNSLPVAIIGGGPVGLAAAAHLITRNEKFILFESGHTVGSNILEWGHVRMFSPWQYNIDKNAKRLLEKTGWESPNQEEIPTGKELVEKYLVPLRQLPEISKGLSLNTKVVGVTKKGLDLLKDTGREDRPFQLYVEINDETKIVEAKAIIDATGTWKTPNPILSNGLWTTAERKLKDQIFYGIPNVLGDMADRYANKSVMVIGSGHSAINALLDLAKLKEKYSNTTIHWVLRKSNLARVYGGQEKDGLPARGELGSRIKRLVESRRINVITPFYISEVKIEESMIVKGDLNGVETEIRGIDEIIVGTGFRPDKSFLNEVRIKLDSAVESVEALAPLIDPNIHSCGTVRPHGEEELRQPEKGLYIVGMKSYGRAPTFLLATGYEQVRSVVAYLTGDHKGAKEVHLELPETGVCSVSFAKSEGSKDESDSCSTNSNENKSSSCCGGIKVEMKSTSCCG